MGYFEERIKKLFSMDMIRLLKFAEMIQYTFIFFVLVTIAAHLINRYYYGEMKDFEKENKGNHTYAVIITDFMYMFMDVMLVLIVFFYIRKIGLLIPSIPALMYPKFKGYTTLEYTTHIAIVVLFVELLPNFKKRIETWNEKTNELI